MGEMESRTDTKGHVDRDCEVERSIQVEKIPMSKYEGLLVTYLDVCERPVSQSYRKCEVIKFKTINILSDG